MITPISMAEWMGLVFAGLGSWVSFMYLVMMAWDHRERRTPFVAFAALSLVFLGIFAVLCIGAVSAWGEL